MMKMDLRMQRLQDANERTSSHGYDWYARNASAKLRIKLMSPGNRAKLSSGTFAWIPKSTVKNDPKIAQSFVFTGSVSIDTSANHKLDKGESFRVTGGTIAVEILSGASQNKQGGVYDVTFNFSLKNGESVSGSYKGVLDLV